MNKEAYYRGFIDACLSNGIKKPKADVLYKRAAGIGGWFSGLKPVRAARVAYNAEKGVTSGGRLLEGYPSKGVAGLGASWSPAEQQLNADIRAYAARNSKSIMPEYLYEDMSRVEDGTIARPGLFERLGSGIGGGVGRFRSSEGMLGKPLGFVKGLWNDFGRKVKNPRIPYGAYKNRFLQNSLVLALRTGNVSSARKIVSQVRPRLSRAEADRLLKDMFGELSGNVRKLQHPLGFVEGWTPATAASATRRNVNISQLGEAYNMAKRQAKDARIANRNKGYYKVFQPYGNFVKKHPIAGFLGTVGAGMAIDNWLSRDARSGKYSTIDTLTPSEESQIRGIDNGYVLPGMMDDTDIY